MDFSLQWRFQVDFSLQGRDFRWILVYSEAYPGGF